MPANALAFAVFVGRQNEFFHILQIVSEFGDEFLLVSRHDVKRIEITFDVDTQRGPRFLFDRRRDLRSARRKVPDVAHAGFDDVIVAQEAGDLFCLCRGFDNDQGLFL